MLFNNRQILQGLPLLRRVDWQGWQPAARGSIRRPLPTRGLLWALRHVVVLSLHAWLSCRWERDAWAAANGQKRRLLVRQLHGHAPWWLVPGVDAAVAWDRAAEGGAMLVALTADLWATWALDRWL